MSGFRGAVGIVAAALTLADPGRAETVSPEVGRESPWQPGAAALQAMRERCLPVGPDFDSCMSRVMADAGASPAAIAFSRRLDFLGFRRALRVTGVVDVAYVTYPFRANENHGILLVNGEPPLVDVDDTARLPRDDLAADPVFAALDKRFPGLLLWPGDRFAAESAAAELPALGGQRFRVPYWLAVCHACERVGRAIFAFDFTAAGRLDGVTLSMVAAAGAAPASALAPVSLSGSPAQAVELARGQGLTVSLATTPSTGYRWRLAGAPEETVLGLSSTRYPPPREARPGAGGEQVFGFTALGPGQATVTLHYVRPWEASATPARTVTIPVVVK